MADSSERKINLAALQRIDPLIIEIIDNASQVALYKYNIPCDKWEESDIKGSFFLYKRSCVPHHGFVIMNRMNTTNQVEPFVSGLDFFPKEPYLLYKNNSRNIYCIWFYEVKDYTRIITHIQRIVKAMKGKARLPRQRYSSESELHTSHEAKVPNIISLLSKAQQEYEKEKGKALVKPVEEDNGLLSKAELHSNGHYFKQSKFCNGDSALLNSRNSFRRRFLSVDESDYSSFRTDMTVPPSDNELKILASHSFSEGNGCSDSFPNANDKALKCNMSSAGKNLAVCEMASNLHVESSAVLTPSMFQNALYQVNADEMHYPMGIPAEDKSFKPSHQSPVDIAPCQEKNSSAVNHSVHLSPDISKKQLGQALIHLLTNEPNMLSKIHGAYISSLNSHIDTLSSS